ncbi:hypothetical protein BS50DRAFT_654311 [Corynespora cassiicola Philippines]|uniref:Uncharacterized protein n=1 Tax=Corynespora cassiicola Philippines TaxID=1448308 RepID=A0A2T2P7K2_CORCC|nr:hypothetical protein BS50DRAFT_654311 [Corynespora cassiicola Philippines]
MLQIQATKHERKPAYNPRPQPPSKKSRLNDVPHPFKPCLFNSPEANPGKLPPRLSNPRDLALLSLHSSWEKPYCKDEKLFESYENSKKLPFDSRQNSRGRPDHAPCAASLFPPTGRPETARERGLLPDEPLTEQPSECALLAKCSEPGQYEKFKKLHPQSYSLAGQFHTGPAYRKYRQAGCSKSAGADHLAEHRGRLLRWMTRVCDVEEKRGCALGEVCFVCGRFRRRAVALDIPVADADLHEQVAVGAEDEEEEKSDDEADVADVESNNGDEHVKG